jgi:hypothetical protein
MNRFRAIRIDAGSITRRAVESFISASCLPPATENDFFAPADPGDVFRRCRFNFHCGSFHGRSAWGGNSIHLGGEREAAHDQNMFYRMEFRLRPQSADAPICGQASDERT